MRKKIFLKPRTLSPLPVKAFKTPRGERRVYLPNFTLTLLRTPHAPPHFASFITPLNLNKLDLKDYLYHAYGVQVLKVRSFVMQAKVEMNKPGGKAQKTRLQFHRPRASKKMTVEMVQEGPGQGPFVWPDPPEDYTPWDKTIWDKAKDAQDDQRKHMGREGHLQPPPKHHVQNMAEQAKRLLAGKEKWRPGWMMGYDVGGLGLGGRGREEGRGGVDEG